jgi:hypothetical protein
MQITISKKDTGEVIFDIDTDDVLNAYQDDDYEISMSFGL